jgi:large subunit ribosomal protein L17
MASSLLKHKRITTTVAKAKALKRYVEPLITKSKNDTTHSRRTVFSYLQDKEAVTTLFRDIAVKVASRPGGYTRILRVGSRPGDNSDMCFIELVDYNEAMLSGKSKKAAAKRTRRGSKKKVEANVENLAKQAPLEVKPQEETEVKPGEEQMPEKTKKAKPETDGEPTAE